MSLFSFFFNAHTIYFTWLVLPLQLPREYLFTNRFSLCVNRETGSGRPVKVSGNTSHSAVHVVHYIIQEVHGNPFKWTLVFTVK